MNSYDKFLREKENNQPIENNAMEKHWAAMETKLNSATQSTFNVRKIIKGLMATAFVCIIAFVIFITTKNKTAVPTSSNILVAKSAIKPPMPQINVPYESFIYDAEKGDTLFTQNGSILIFPKNAVLNNKGEIVTGGIEIRTREFNDPLDYYMAGIPMTYDSAGVKYTFVSSGMIDIKAYQNNELLFVNPNAKPQLNLVSTNNERNTNLYILDTTNGQWINKGKDEVNDVATMPKQNFTNTRIPKNDKPISENEYDDEQPKKDITTVQKPLPPQKASGKNPTIEIIIDPASFKELLVYNNLKFEVLNSVTETVGEDSKTEWDNVELLHDDKSVNYIAKFSKGSKSVQYKVKPVLEEKDYEQAVTVYNEKIRAYNDLQKDRITSDKLVNDENKKTITNNEAINAKNKVIEIENKRIEELNTLITARNERLAALKKRYLLEIEKQKKTTDSLQLVWEENNKGLSINNKLIRSFTIDGFGYWNCDIPTVPNTIPIAATFTNTENNILNFTTISVSSKGTNRIIGYNNNNVRVLPNVNHIFWGTYQNEFYYLTFKEYEKLNIKPETRTNTFKLSKYEGDANSLTGLKKILYGG